MFGYVVWSFEAILTSAGRTTPERRFSVCARGSNRVQRALGRSVWILLAVLMSLGCAPPSSAKVASELLNNAIHGNDALAAALADPEPVLWQIYRQTDGLARSGYIQAPRIVLVLRQADTPGATGLAALLWERPLPPLSAVGRSSDYRLSVSVPEEMVLLPKCIGAYALATDGLLSAEDAQCLLPYIQDPRYRSDLNRTLGLMLLILGHAHCTAAVPAMLEAVPLLQGENSTATMPVVLLEALGLMGDPRAVVPLRSLLKTWEPVTYKDEGKRVWDIGPRALRALILLGDIESVDLFLERCEGAPTDSREALLCLERLTAQPLGPDSGSWETWRRIGGKDFKLSAPELAVLRREADRAGELWLLGFTTHTGPMPERTPAVFSSLEQWQELVR